jgi:hypothetical protein
MSFLQFPPTKPGVCPVFIRNNINMKILLACCFTLFSAFFCAAQDTTLRVTVLFETGKFELQPEVQQQLQQLVTAAGERMVYRISITGYTDDVGASEANDALSRQRARAVYDWLVAKLGMRMAMAKKQIAAMGENDPACSNGNNEGRECNRRVTLTLWLENRTPVSIADVYASIASEPQTFCYRNNRDTMFVCRQGSLVLVKAETIDIPPGFEDACIEVVVREALTRYDILTNNLSTASEQRPMVSEAMIQVRFFSRRRELFLKKDQNFTVLSPSGDANTVAGLYEGVWQPDGQIDWQQPKGGGNALQQNTPASQLNNCLNGGFRNCAFKEDTVACNNCDLFFCGIGKWMKGWFSAKKRLQAKQYFDCKQEVRAAKKQQEALSRSPAISAPPISGATMDSMYKIYARQSAVSVLRDSLDECGRFIARFGIQDLNLQRQQLQRSIDSMLRNGNPLDVAQLDKLQYDIFNWQGNSWANIDWMFKVPESQMVQVDVLLQPDAYTDCKMVFKKQRTVLPGVRNAEGRFVFPFLPPGEPAWLLMVNTRTGTGKLQAELKELNTATVTVTPMMGRYSIADFASLLKGVDRKF